MKKLILALTILAASATTFAADAQNNANETDSYQQAVTYYLDQGFSLDQARELAAEATNASDITATDAYQDALTYYLEQGFSLDQARKLALEAANNGAEGDGVVDQEQEAINYYLSQGFSLDQARKLAEQAANN